MSIFKNNKEEENRVAASEPHVEQESEVLSAEDVKALAPLYDNVVLALKQVYDPEIPVNIYDLGLIYELVINKNHEAFIKMTFTAPNCPMADEVLEEVGLTAARVAMEVLGTILAQPSAGAVTEPASPRTS